MEENRQTLVDLGYEDAVVFDNPSFDGAIIGVSHDGRVVYCFDKMVECLIDGDESEDAYTSAVEFIECNTLRSLPYIDKAPIVVMNMGSFYLF